jgi:hypothetical protein
VSTHVAEKSESKQCKRLWRKPTCWALETVFSDVYPKGKRSIGASNLSVNRESIITLLPRTSTCVEWGCCQNEGIIL